MKLEPQAEHQWLTRMLGDWISEGEATMEPGKPPVQFKTTESVRTIGGLWVLCEGCGAMPDGSPTTTLMTLGYDPAKQRYLGTFLGSMMTHLWVYEGTMDATGRVLTLDTEGPNFAAAGKMIKYRDVIEFKSDDHRVLSSLTQFDDGTWHHFMTAHYRRTR